MLHKVMKKWISRFIVGVVLSLISTVLASGQVQAGLTYHSGTGSPSVVEQPAGSWLSGYNYRKQITIDGTIDGAQTNYQMQLDIFYGSGSDSGNDVYLDSNCQTDFDDIRFTTNNGVDELDHWREEYTVSTDASFWIEFDSIPASPSSEHFYIYYGNVAASSASNGANTFIFFDDFERGNDGDEVGGGWSEDTGTIEISVGQVYGGTRSMKLEGAAARPVAKRADVADSETQAIRYRVYKEDASEHFFYHGDATNRCVVRVTTADDIEYYDGSYHDTGSNLPVDQWVLLEFNDFDWTGATYDIIMNGSNISDDTAMQNSAYEHIVQLSGRNLATQDTWIDDVLVRKWTATEPTWGSWGSEEAFRVPPPAPIVGVSYLALGLAAGVALWLLFAFDEEKKKKKEVATHGR